MKRHLMLLLIAILALNLPSRASAQQDRYDLGRRIGAFELAWEKITDAGARKRALETLKPASVQMLSMQLEDAGRIFDDARFVLTSSGDAAPRALWADALSVRLGSRLIDAGETELPFTLQAFYKVPAALPKDASVILQLFAGKGKPLQVPVAKLPTGGTLPLVSVPEGDHPVFVTIKAGDRTVGQTLLKLSVVKNLRPRLEKLKQATAAFGQRVGTADQETVCELYSILDVLAKRETKEIDFPAARLLAEAEAAVESIKAGKRFYGGERTGQFWLRLPNANSAVAMRMLAPESVKEKKPLPLVIAVHGVGGSENLFFEAYGSGVTAKLCQQRGWLLVAPRGGLLAGGYSMADVIDEVAKLYPVDKSKVFAVGYSLGGGHAVTAAQETPHRLAAVAALGSGGTIKAKSDIRNVSFFVGVGTNDLAVVVARGLRDKLKKSGVSQVDYREYDNVEHFSIVREALPDAFAMFDRIAKGK